MKAMILAAGEGTRLRPLTLETPKPLLPVAGIPLIEYILVWLKSHGISEVAVNLHHKGDMIKRFLGDGHQLGVKIVYSEEEMLLGTAGGVKKMEGFFDGAFVVFYGDNLTDFDLSAMLRFHRQKNAMVTLAIFEPPNPSEVGVVQMNGDERILALVEKPHISHGRVRSPVLANGGVYVLEQKVFEFIDGNIFADFASDVFPRLISSDLPVYGFKLKPDDYFIDIGTLTKYNQANEDVEAAKIRINHEKQGSFS